MVSAMAHQVKTPGSRQENEKRLIAAIEKKHGTSVAQLRQERDKRIRDAIELKEPDRLPVTLNAGAFAARYAGLPTSVMYYDPAAYRESCIKVLLHFEPDQDRAQRKGASVIRMQSEISMGNAPINSEAGNSSCCYL